MPEYFAPGVYVEEVSFRSKTIEGVPTSTTGFAGRTRTGPIRYADGPVSNRPRLVTSYTEFESVYGGLEPFQDGTIPFVAHAARMFFANGGQRLYISRVFVNDGNNPGVASFPVAPAGGGPLGSVTWRARWPGAYGNVKLTVTPMRGGNIVSRDSNGNNPTFKARPGTVVEVGDLTPSPRGALGNLAVVRADVEGNTSLVDDGGNAVIVGATQAARVIELRVDVQIDAERVQTFTGLAPFAGSTRYIGKILQPDDPEDENACVWLDVQNQPVRRQQAPNPQPPDIGNAIPLVRALVGAFDANTSTWASVRLAGGNDGLGLTIEALAGREANPDIEAETATGLEALGEIDDIAIVALPDGGGLGGDLAGQAADRVIAHAERLRYRIAVIDAPQNQSMTAIRAFRGRLDSKYAALYHPWLEILNPLERPTQGAPPSRLMIPPSGAVCGIYARSDVERGVHKAPANEVVRGLTQFEANINTRRQQVLNPEGINALRFFEGRGNRVWGARTITSDPEWKYVNVRRLFIYLEHSIDKATQYAVFEPNNERLWASIRQSVEDFLYVQWRNGALLGTKPEDAFFVRCDRTTMAQNDLDNGRLICLIGVAPVLPAEFVIFRIGQFTANSKS